MKKIWKKKKKKIYNLECFRKLNIQRKRLCFFHLIFFLEVLQHWIILPNDFLFFHVCLCFFSSRALGIPASASTKIKNKNFLQTSQGPMHPVTEEFQDIHEIGNILYSSWQLAVSWGNGQGERSDGISIWLLHHQTKNIKMHFCNNTKIGPSMMMDLKAQYNEMEFS